MSDSKLTDRDLQFLRRAINLARAARSKGNAPFGAVLANERGDVLGEGENTEITHQDPTGHAESNILKNIHQRHSRKSLQACTMFASGEPCVMCAAAMVWSGVGRVVFAVASPNFPAKMGDLPPRPASIKMDCRHVFAVSQPRIEVIGPVLEEEGLIAFQ